MADDPAERILIVESDVELRGSLSDSMRRAGRQVVSASSADDGIALLDAAPPDAAVIDLAARTSAGELCIAAIRGRSADVPILVLGDSDHAAEFQAALPLGRLWYIARDAAPEHVERTFQTMMERTRPGHTLA